MDERNDLILRQLRDIRTKQDEQSQVLEEHTHRFDQVDRHLDRLSKVVTFSLGQNTETQFRQAEQETRIDELFERLGNLLGPREPA